MVLWGDAFIFLGVFGFTASTFGSSGLAWLLSFFSRSYRATEYPVPLSLFTLDIVIAAHNEEKQILLTLDSLERERVRFMRSYPARVRIWVGLDHCTDETEERAFHWVETHDSDVMLVRNPGAPGKWNILRHLASECTSDWIALVDVGAAWESGLLSEALPHLLNPQVSGVAPSYRAVSPGIFERFVWGLERILKALEARAGGPISVHGASVLYRRAHLLQAYAELDREHPRRGWLNDDVVIPLMMRILRPQSRIAYLFGKNGNAWVHDHGVSRTEMARDEEPARRKRILIGNLQWMSALYVRAIRSSATVGLIASRRVFRAFWAYWLLCGMFGATLVAISYFKSPLAISFLSFTCFAALLRLKAAFSVGLKLPVYWRKYGTEIFAHTVEWKTKTLHIDTRRRKSLPRAPAYAPEVADYRERKLG